MLTAAERLIAERGVEAVSLREVGQTAGQRNNSAAQYHFGDKAGLVAAVIDRRSPGVEARRLAMFAEFADRQPTVRQLLEAFVCPLADTLLAQTPDEPSYYLRFLHQVVLARAAGAQRLETHQPGVSQLNAALLAITPPVTPARFARRMTWLAQTTLQVLAEQERRGARTRSELSEADLAEVTADLLTALEALITAPPT